MFFDPLYLLILAPAFLFSAWAAWKTRSAFNKYSKVRTAAGLTGAQAAQTMLSRAGIQDVEVVATRGKLSDHYNPVTKKLALSEPVYGTASVAAVGVACHEAGHAIQHAKGYAPLHLRSLLVPTANIGSKLGWIVMFAGLILSSTNIVLIGAVLFSAVLLFQLVTLPVEFDASRRAKALATDYGIVQSRESEGMAKVLNAAAMTYVAAAMATLLTLLYYLLRAGIFGGRD